MDIPRLQDYNFHAKTGLTRSPQRLPPCSASSPLFENGGARWYDICNAEKNVGGREERLPPAGNTIVKRVSLVWNELDWSVEPVAVLADEYGDTEAPVQGGSRRERVGCHKPHLMMRL
jgi:hypothetical protein